MIPEGVKSIGDETFGLCTHLEEVQLPKSLRFIGWGAFCGCISLQEIVIPEGVETIGALCFTDCSSLEKIQLPSTLRSIGRNAFRGCFSLTEIVLECVEPPEVYRDFFPEDATLYVPAESVEKYKNWCESRLSIQSIQSKES